MKSFKIVNHYIILTATLFIVLLQPLHSFQHYYNEVLNSCETHSHLNKTDDATQNHEDNCPLCDFTYQPYIATDFLVFETLSFTKLLKPYIYLDSNYTSESLFYNYLRGPPVSILG